MRNDDDKLWTNLGKIGIPLEIGIPPVGLRAPANPRRLRREKSVYTMRAVDFACDRPSLRFVLALWAM